MLPICTEAAKSVHTALVGRTCEAFFEQKWYNGILLAHGGWTDHPGSSCLVSWIIKFK